LALTVPANPDELKCDPWQPGALNAYPSIPKVAPITEIVPRHDVSMGLLGIAVSKEAPTAVLQALNDLINDSISTDPMKTQ
jgi:hypothetical protein